ncbi:hypothetical protein SB49_11035 [Sediminicola sp. YIK13]|uniref:DUF2141 domain-containing protein n=1 Tax=Sediminicola sp. YIK13 TaxID=1453352 RepID=UPI0007213CE7|nr:DUF2141 domain-containing protein [Sediminicola sp. YIK13]ALM08275.1 hypothetical protein SB49_11035 [Sediminicola sp. YIK13]
MRHLLLIILFPIIGFSQNNLSIDVEGVASSEGRISVAVYNSSTGFLKFETVYRSDSTSAKKKKTNLVITNLPNGTYALAVFHDKNGNNKLDTNWLGIPKEAIGFSNAKMKMFGPPSFEDCAFNLKGDAQIHLELN